MRYTVREFELAVAGWIVGQAVQWDRLAWQTAHLMNATGNFKDTRWTARMLLGREPLPDDPRADRAVHDPPPDPEEAEALSAFWADGTGDGLTRGRATPEEMQRAYEEARVTE